MGAKISAAMVKAKKLVIEQGVTPCAAAKQCNITRQSIYMAPWYKTWKAAQK